MKMRTVRPKLIDDVLVNPNMGFTTFQRFNGDPLFAGGKWSEFGPEHFPHANDPPTEQRPTPMAGFPDTTIAYCRWYWATLNPEPGVIRWEIIENACRSAAARGQQLDLRIAPHNGEVTVPPWYRDAVGRGSLFHDGGFDEWAANPVGPPSRSPVSPREAKGPGKWLPDYSDPAYLEHFGGLIRAVGQRYDGDPRINMIDVGMFGHWGEWHRSDNQMGTPELWRRGIELFVDAWPTTPKVMLIAKLPQVAYACLELGCGWRLDCWGDMGGFSPNWNHMIDCYNQALCKAAAQDVWKHAPVSLETCWVMDKWHQDGWDIDYIIDQALRWHVTSINLKSSAVPDDWWPRVNHLQKNMGYRIALRRMAYATQVAAGGALRVEATWENRGIAPPYHGYPAVLALKNDHAEHVLELAGDTRDWLPGYQHIERDLPLPPEAAPGAYRLRAALLCPHTRRPVVQLANEGRGPDGWYDLGNVEITA